MSPIQGTLNQWKKREPPSRCGNWLVTYAKESSPGALVLSPVTNNHSLNQYHRRPRSLRMHIKTHTNERRAFPKLLLSVNAEVSIGFLCPVPGCGRRYTAKSNMRRHLRTHKPGDWDIPNDLDVVRMHQVSQYELATRDGSVIPPGTDIAENSAQTCKLQALKE